MAERGILRAPDPPDPGTGDLDPQLSTMDPAWRDSPLWSEDLAPVPARGRTWTRGHIAAIWVGMAVCIPTYMLAASMMQAGLGWVEALVLIGLANLLIAVPMVLNGHAGVRYGIPFPVLGRAAFGWRGVHIPAMARALVACGWFGIQTWVGGVAIYALGCALAGTAFQPGLVAGKFIGFGLFWMMNVWFIWKGTESIKRLEAWSAPVLLVMGVALVVWGAVNGGGIRPVLDKGRALQQPTLHLETSPNGPLLHLRPLTDFSSARKARERQLQVLALDGNSRDTLALGPWTTLRAEPAAIGLSGSFPEQFGRAAEPNGREDSATSTRPLRIEARFRGPSEAGKPRAESSWVGLDWPADAQAGPPLPPGTGLSPEQAKGAATVARRNLRGRLGLWLFWLTGMVGFWATMSLSIADITRYARSQRDQIQGQFLGLPGTMVAYSFVGIFATCAALGLFADVLVVEDAPWDPASLLARFERPGVVILAQLSLLVATLSTNIAANVIAPANAFANWAPQRISFRTGGLMAAGLGVLLMPWWLVDRIAPALLVISAFFGPILGVMLADYWTLRRQRLDLDGLYRTDGPYRYTRGFHRAALWALALGTLPTLLGYLVPALSLLYDGSWFIGFAVAFAVYLRFARSASPGHGPR